MRFYFCDKDHSQNLCCGIFFCSTTMQNQLVLPKIYISVHASTLFKIQVTPVSDPDYYQGQWVIWLSDAEAVSTLLYNISSGTHLVS